MAEKTSKMLASKMREAFAKAGVDLDEAISAKVLADEDSTNCGGGGCGGGCQDGCNVSCASGTA